MNGKESDMPMDGRKVLLVDDDERNVFALSSYLESEGYDVVSVSGGQEALDTVHARNDIAVILLDIMMPEMDGFEVMKRLRENGKGHIPVVAVTAKAMKGDRELCLEAGAAEYVSKPIDLIVLTGIMEKIIRMRP